MPRPTAPSESFSHDAASIIDALAAPIGYIDRSLHLRFLNKAFSEWFGGPTGQLLDRPVAEILGEEDYACALPYMRAALEGKPQRYERTLDPGSARPRHILAAYTPHTGADGSVCGFFTLINDITELTESRDALRQQQGLLEQMVQARTQELSQANALLQDEVALRRRAERVAETEKHAMELICSGTGLAGVLEWLCIGFERLCEGGHCSVLIADAERRFLVRSIAPTLPAAFVQAIGDVPIGADVGTSGAAAFLKQHVYVEDITRDPRWLRYRQVALANGIRAVWSEPILSSEGEVLGTFTIYHALPRPPTQEERALMQRATHLATIALERDLAAKRLSSFATHDPLTHLPNRNMFQETLGKAIARAQRSGLPFALMFIDLDYFKNVNDELGHEYGDELLRQVAKRLSGSVRAGDTICRLGGDEFTAIIENIGRPRDAEEIAAKLAATLAHRFEILGEPVQISCSIGVALCPLHGKDSQSLLRKADAAMYHAKSRGRNTWQVHVASRDGDKGGGVPLEYELRDALALCQLRLVYQPQFDVASGRIHSVEALLRWDHPRLGLLAPRQFLAHAEEGGLIVQIGKWVLREACRQVLSWREAGHALRLAVNIAPRQLRQPDFALFVLRELEKIQMPATMLTLELNECALVASEPQAYENLERLKAGGVQLIVDDFGSVYAPPGPLTRLPADALKIDKALAQAAVGDTQAAAVLDALVRLAKGLDVPVMAQGIEGSDQLEFLIARGCRQVQGYALSQPLNAEEFERVLLESPAGAVLRRPGEAA